MRVFFDASVIIASILSPSGGSSLLLQYVKLGQLVGITSQTVVWEITDEKKSKKIKKTKNEIEDWIAGSALLVRKAITTAEIIPYTSMVDINDAHLVAGARLTHCTHLVTLDKKHLLRADVAQKFQPLQIVSPKELLEEIVA